MLSVFIILGSILILYFIGYRIYGNVLDKNLINPDDSNSTPAHTLKDDVDFYPAQEIVLFGHHFSSIAGAGPIIGPIVALMNFGWAPALVWIILGSILMGGVHDYTSLMVSARNGGKSISEVAEKSMSKKASLIFSAFIWITLILVVSVFAILVAKTLVASPEMVIPTFGLILIAVIFGKVVYSGKVSLLRGTVLAVSANIGLILLGAKYPISLPANIMGFSPVQVWFFVVLIYCSIASILPVQVLLQPRDYISTFNLYGCLLLGISAIILVHPKITAPAFIGFNSTKGPIYPMLFVLVACGAISGFHSLVSGGTTSKQLDKESHGKPIAYGGMLTEAVLAILTLLLVGGGLYWASPIGKNVNMNLLGIHQVFKSGGWILVFGRGFGNLVHKMIPALSITISSMLAMIALNTFVLTTTDTATRVTRFVIQETLGTVFTPLKNKYIALLFCMIPIFVVGYTNSASSVWPVFGAANQLIASLTLLVVSSYFLSKSKPIKYTFYPAMFMLITTIAALLWQGYHFILGPKPNYLLLIICIALVILAIFVFIEAILSFKRKKEGSPS